MNKLKTALVFGTATSICMIISWIIPQLFNGNESGNIDMNLMEISGFIAMFLSMAVVFLGMKNYRDKVHAGIISFKDAFLSGLYIVLVTSIIYVIGWMIYAPLFMPDFADQYIAQQIENLKLKELTELEYNEKVEALKSQMEAYENPFIRAGMTFMEFFPIGLVFSLIWAWDPEAKKERLVNEVFAIQKRARNTPTHPDTKNPHQIELSTQNYRNRINRFF